MKWEGRVREYNADEQTWCWKSVVVLFSFNSEQGYLLRFMMGEEMLEF